MLIKREVLDRLGGLSEEVERIFFEDEDFSIRAQRAGYRCVVAEGAYVHHTEHQTVRHMPEREALFTRNRRWCEEKWGRPLRIAWPRIAHLVPGSDELRAWLERLIEWARRRTYVYAYAPLSPRMTPRALFDSVTLIPHADIRWMRTPQYLAPWAAAGWILARRKKPFDIIVSPNARWARAMEPLAWLHRAAIIPEGQPDQLLLAWQRAARLPSSR
jgi:hypothetical protein